MVLRKFIIRACIVSGFLFLAACGAQKQYSMEDMDLPDLFQIPDSVTKSLDSTLIPRSQFFRDSTLRSLIDLALVNNFDVRIADKEMDINEAYFKQSKAAFYPRLNLNLFNIERRWFSENSRFAPSSDYYEHKGKEPSRNLYAERLDHYSRGLLDWEIDIWGKLRNEKRAASALYQQSKIAKRAMETELIATVSEDYYMLLSLDEQLEVAEENHKYRDSTLNMINLLYNAGEVSALAVQQAQTQVLEASTLISRLSEQRSIQENNLRLLIGRLPGIIDRRTTLTSGDSAYNEVKELPLYLVQNRPDVIVSQFELTAANARVGVAQAERYPSLTISAEGGLESLLPQNWFNIPGSLFGSFIGDLTLPFLNGRELKTEHEVAMFERDEAEINFQRNVYEAVVDIQNTLTSIERLEEQLETANVQQLVAQRALNNSRMLFSSGFADYLEVITAQSEALNSELELVQTKAALLTMRVQLYRALGGGWY